MLRVKRLGWVAVPTAEEHPKISLLKMVMLFLHLTNADLAVIAAKGKWKREVGVNKLEALECTNTSSN